MSVTREVEYVQRSMLCYLHSKNVILVEEKKIAVLLFFKQINQFYLRGKTFCEIDQNS